LAVDRYQILRIVRRKRRKQSNQVLSLSRLPHQPLRRGGQFFELMRRQILHHELKSAELPQSLNGRWQRRKYNRARYSKQPWSDSIHNRRRGMFLAFALRIWLQGYKDISLIFVRHEPCRHSREHKVSKSQAGEE